MARMIPATLFLQTESMAENKLFHVLQNTLDDSYTIFHSFDVLRRNIKNKLLDAEIDFLIFLKSQGFLVIEVKGGAVKYDGKSGRWFQNSVLLSESPYHQAKKNKYAVSEYLEKTLGKKLPIVIGHAVCFPDVFSDIPVLPAEADLDITITARELQYLDTVIPSIIDKHRKDHHRPLNNHESETVQKALMPEFEYGASLVDRIGAAEERIFKLTEEQCALLDFLGNRRRVLVKGCAGSGKTVLAVKKAREFALEGKKVLLLSYNIPLGQVLEKSAKNINGEITATNYHSFCLGKLKDARIELSTRQDNEFWQSEIPEKFDKLLAKHPIKYDAIIVDEGQDFIAPYWITIEEMLSPDGYFYIFYDPDQNLYDSELHFPIKKEPFNLTTNCRNTLHIGNALLKYADSNMKFKNDTPKGEPIIEVRCSSNHERRKELGRILHQLVNKEGIKPDKIVILGGHKINHTCLGENQKIGNFTIALESKESTQSIRYDTYMRFKGCEADVVILLDVDAKDSRWSNPNALYTAMSRAKFLLYILHKG